MSFLYFILFLEEMYFLKFLRLDLFVLFVGRLREIFQGFGHLFLYFVENRLNLIRVAHYFFLLAIQDFLILLFGFIIFIIDFLMFNRFFLVFLMFLGFMLCLKFILIIGLRLFLIYPFFCFAILNFCINH